MPRPPRHQNPDTYYFITNRTAKGVFYLRPDKECNRIIRGVLARAADLCEVNLAAYLFEPNHFHIVAQFPLMNRDDFMKRVSGQISDRVNDYRGTSGSMFPERYSVQALVDDQALLDKLCYILNNPVKDGLVESTDEWPGVSSMPSHQTGKPLTGEWLDHAKWTKLSRRKTSDHTRDEAMREHIVDLHLPDALEGQSDVERRKSLVELVEDDRKRIIEEAEASSGVPPSFKGRSEVVLTDWQERPKQSPADKPERSEVLPVCTTEPGGIRAYLQARLERTRKYREAARALRRGKEASFPHGTHPPGQSRCIGHEDACERARAGPSG